MNRRQQQLVEQGLAAGGFKAEVAKTVRRTVRMSPKQRAVLSKQTFQEVGDWDYDYFDEVMYLEDPH